MVHRRRVSAQHGVARFVAPDAPPIQNHQQDRAERRLCVFQSTAPSAAVWPVLIVEGKGKGSKHLGCAQELSERSDTLPTSTRSVEGRRLATAVGGHRGGR